jgi:hypothetical protein
MTTNLLLSLTYSWPDLQAHFLAPMSTVGIFPVAHTRPAPGDDRERDPCGLQRNSNIKLVASSSPEMSSHEDDPLRLEMPEQKDEQQQEPWPLPLFRSNILTNMAGAGVPKTWGNPSGVPDHFVRHGADVGAKNAESYVDQASEFRKRSQTDGLPTKIDPKGTIRIYDPASNTFGAYNADGTTKTFFKPTSPTYFDRQPGVPPTTFPQGKR